MTLSPDLTISQRYRLVARIAVGGMGEVWRAHDEVLGRDVAVKVLKEDYAADPSFLDRFRAEARHTAALSHPGIANVFDYGEVGDMAFLVMELVHGEPLSAILGREGRLSPARMLDIVGQAGLALQAAHDAGVVHRDVKPGNLLVRPDGVVKVTDFGIARAVDAAPVTQTGLLVGTAAYLSPEQAAGRPVTAQSDVYSLGVVAYECLAGNRPFQADSAVGTASAHVHAPVPPLPADVPPLVASFVTRALEKDPARRQPSAGDFGRTALALAHQLSTAPPQTSVLSATEVAAADVAAHPSRVAASDEEPATVQNPMAGRPAGDVAADDAERKRIRNIFVAIGAVVVVAGFFLLRSCGASPTRYATVPRVVGESYPKAAADLRQHGFRAVRQNHHSLHVAAGTVAAQSVPSGRQLPVGRAITLTVSTGPAEVTVDANAYIGRPFAAVRTALRTKHLRVRAVTGAPTAPAGTVTAVDPTGPVKEGTTVTVTVAAAPPARPGPKPPGHGHGHEKHGHGD